MTRKGSNQFKAKKQPIISAKMVAQIYLSIVLVCISAGMYGKSNQQVKSYLSPVAHAQSVGITRSSAGSRVIPTVTPAPDSTNPEKTYIYTKKHGDVIWRIYGLESTWGKAYDGCKDNRQVNGFGFGQTDDHSSWFCYPSRQAVVDSVEQWLEHHLDEEHMTLRDALCIYNQGTASLCPYADHFLDLPSK